MYRTRIHKFIIYTAIGFLILLNCSQPSKQSDKINVVVSIPPLAEFVEKVGGDRVSVMVMVPPGASPHTYEPSPKQLIAVSKADLFIKVGAPIEFELIWLDKLLSLNENMLVVNASQGIALAEAQPSHNHNDPSQHEQHSVDPHVWLSPLNAEKMVENIYQGLVTLDPQHKDYYFKNKTSYLRELESLDKAIEKYLADKKFRTFMVYHPAWTYFAQRYHLKQISIEKEGKEPTAKGLQQVIKLAKENNIKVIFTSPQDNPRSADIIAREIKGRVIPVSPVAKEYIANLKNLTLTLLDTME